MKANLIIFFLLCLVIINNGMNFGKETEQSNTKAQLNQFSKPNTNALEIITYIERYGRPHSGFGPVAGIGDINCDGFDDVIIGNWFNGGKWHYSGVDTIPDTYTVGPGEALIFFGGAEMDSIPDIILHGENDGDHFGSTVASAGDFNGDGYSDFLVTASWYPAGLMTGRVYIYFGGVVLDTIPDVILTGENEGDGFGMVVAHGDVNNDGCDDLLISAPGANYSNGKVYLFSYQDNFPVWHAQKDSCSLMGINLAIGDINGDKKKDLLINSTPLINRRGGSHIVTEIFLNHDGFDTTASFSIIDTSLYNYPYQVLLSHDFNQDGYDDFLLRKCEEENRVNLYLGSAELDTLPDGYLEDWGLITISRLANAGDVNGDGYPDILAGHWHLVFESSSAALYLGGKQVNPKADWVAWGGGKFIDGVGDVNGDGYDDIAVGTLTLPYTSVAWGQMWILAGSPELKDISSIAEEKKTTIIPVNFQLRNYPNPFNACTTISYVLPGKGVRRVVLKVIDTTGKEVKELVDENQREGEHQIFWDGHDQIGKEVSSGVYLCVLRAGSTQQSLKILLLR